MATGLAAPGPLQFFLASGAVNASGSVVTCLVGTSTPVATYTDYDLVTPNATTVTLDSSGYPASGGIFLDSTIAYTFTEKDAAGATVKTYNIAALFNGPYAIAGTLAVTGAVTLSSTLAVAGNVTVNSGTFAIIASSGATTIAAPAATNGSLTIKSPSTYSSNVSFNQDSTNIWKIGHNIAIGSKVFEIYNTTNAAAQMQITEAGAAKFLSTVESIGGFKMNGTAGVATFGPAGVASISVRGGIVTAIS